MTHLAPALLVLSSALSFLATGCSPDTSPRPETARSNEGERTGSGSPEGKPAATLPGEPEPPPAIESWPIMGTIASLTVPAEDGGRLAEISKLTKGVFEDLNASLSIYRPDSEISRLNASAGGKEVEISPSTREMLHLAIRYADLTGGAFEPTIAPLVWLWGFSGKPEPIQVPSAPAIEAASKRVGWRHLILAERTARLELPEMSVDLGGIAKGYAVDVAYEKLLERGAGSFLVNLGGNIRCHGLARPSRPWRVGVRDPFTPGGILGAVMLRSGMALATSGHYERFVVIEGVKYAHILDPRTGYPVKGMAGVTVLCPTAVETDALSTALFVLGPDASMPILAKVPGCEAIFVPDRQPMEIWITPGLRQTFEPEPPFAGSVRLIETRE